MFESIMNFFKNLRKTENKESKSKDKAKERLHLVLMQDRANVSADFLEMMKQEIIEVIKKYIEVDEKEIDVRLTNEVKEDGTTGAPSLYANIPIMNIKNEMKKQVKPEEAKEDDNKNKVDVDNKEEEINKEEETSKTQEDNSEDKSKENVKNEELEEDRSDTENMKEEDKTENEGKEEEKEDKKPEEIQEDIEAKEEKNKK